MSTVHEMFASGDEQEVQAILREVDELRRARGLQQLGPWCGNSTTTVSSVLTGSGALTCGHRAPKRR